MAVERVVRRIDQRDGLPVTSVSALCQDARGFLWIGTAAGLARYDGSEIVPWGRDRATGEVASLAAGPRGEVMAVTKPSLSLFEVVPDGLATVLGPGGAPLTEVTSETFDRGGRLWIARAGAILGRTVDGSWTEPPRASLGGERAVIVRAGPAGGLFVATADSIWAIDDDGRSRRLFTFPRVEVLLPRADGSLWASSVADGGKLVEFSEGRVRERLTSTGRPIDLAESGRLVWASFEHRLAALGPDDRPETIGSSEEVPGFGPLLVDTEGSLWMGSVQGLLRFPEPETVTWTERDGLPPYPGLHLARKGRAVRILTWGGTALVERDAAGWRVTREMPMRGGQMCEETNGRAWSTTRGAFVEESGGTPRRFPIRGEGFELQSCATAPDGTTWLGTTRGLYRSVAAGGAPLAVTSPADGHGEALPVFAALETRSGDLWIGAGESACSAPSRSVAAGAPVWRCTPLPGCERITGFHEWPSGELWASTSRAGVFRMRGAKWDALPGARKLASQTVFCLRPSPTGGVWIGGHGILLRVVSRPELPDGWEILESPSGWHGIPGGEVGDVLEENDGTLWLAAAAGLVRLSSEARRDRAEPPRIELARLLVDGQAVALSPPPELPFSRNRVEMRFAALSYRDRSRLRVRLRLRENAPWTVATGDATFRFVDLAAGRYRVEAAASLDGERWSRIPATFEFRIDPPLYRRPWALAVDAFVVALALYALYRLRVAFLIRLERQRTRIAMDLHDELGSGLGGIGIVADVLAEPDVPDDERRRLAKSVAGTAGELGDALTDIVWSLRAGNDTLEALAFHLAERGGRLFPGHETVFVTEFPQRFPRVDLPLAVRRNLQLIVREALYNTARHAAAKRVVLAVAPVEDRWRISIRDDGKGLTPRVAPRDGGGLGLESMRRRAREIGAALTISAEADRGTTVSVVFRPSATSGGAPPERRTA